MPEWISNFLTTITSAKTAIKILLTVVLITLSWGMANSLLKEKGIPDEIGYFLLSLSCFSVSLIVTEIAYVAYKLIEKKLQTWHVYRETKREKLRMQVLEDAQKKRDDISFRSQVNLTFLHLDHASKKLLRELFEKENLSLPWSQNPTYQLNKLNFIKCIGDVNRTEKIYELNPIIKEYLLNEQHHNLTELSKFLDENSKQFLRIFFDESIPFGCSEKEIWMDSLIYRSHEKMVRLKAIEKHDDTFILSSDFKSILISDGYFKNCYRTEVTLDPTRIEAYIPTTIKREISS